MKTYTFYENDLMELETIDLRIGRINEQIDNTNVGDQTRLDELNNKYMEACKERNRLLEKCRGEDVNWND